MGSMIGIPGIILILVVALLLFGPNKLPELGRAFGRTLQEFKRGARDVISEDDSSKQDSTKQDGSKQELSKDNAHEQTEKKDQRRLPE